MTSGVFTTAAKEHTTLSSGDAADGAKEHTKVFPPTEERRKAMDGKFYTYNEYYRFYGARASRKWEWSRIISGDAQTDAHGAPNADGAAKNLSEAGGAIEHTDNGISQPSRDQVAYVTKIMGDYRKEDWLDDEEKWKRELAQQTLEARWHGIEMIEQFRAGAIEHPTSGSSGA